MVTLQAPRVHPFRFKKQNGGSQLESYAFLLSVQLHAHAYTIEFFRTQVVRINKQTPAVEQ